MLLGCNVIFFDITTQRSYIPLCYLRIRDNIDLIAKDERFIRQRHIIRVAFLVQHIELRTHEVRTISDIRHDNDRIRLLQHCCRLFLVKIRRRVKSRHIVENDMGHIPKTGGLNVDLFDSIGVCGADHSTVFIIPADARDEDLKVP